MSDLKHRYVSPVPQVLSDLKHRYVSPVPQVYHSHWDDKSAPKSYFRDIDTLAGLVGEALSTVSHTIYVSQSKEKFGSARVYMHLADPGRICDAYVKEQGLITALAQSIDNGMIEVPESFTWQCTVNDAAFYRDVYMSFARIVPHYRDALFCSADLPGLLCETKEELDELIASKYYSYCGFEIDDPKARDELYKICGFKQ